MTRLERIRADLASGGVFYGAAGPMTLITKEDVAWLVEMVDGLMVALQEADRVLVGPELVGAEHVWPNVIRAKQKIVDALARLKEPDA